MSSTVINGLVIIIIIIIINIIIIKVEYKLHCSLYPEQTVEDWSRSTRPSAVKVSYRQESIGRTAAARCTSGRRQPSFHSAE